MDMICHLPRNAISSATHEIVRYLQVLKLSLIKSISFIVVKHINVVYREMFREFKFIVESPMSCTRLIWNEYFL